MFLKNLNNDYMLYILNKYLIFLAHLITDVLLTNNNQ